MRWNALSSEDRDWLLAEHVLHLHEDHHPRSHATVLLSALQKLAHDKFLLSWKVLSIWQAETPPVQATALDFTFALGLCMAVFAAQPDAGAALMLCLFGLLRISESLQLTWSRVFFAQRGDTAVLVFPKTKRGKFEKVVLHSSAMVRLLRQMQRVASDEKSST